MSQYYELFKCLTKYGEYKEKWAILMDRQQKLLESADKMECDTEFKNFMIAKHEFENQQCIDSSKKSVLEYCQNFHDTIIKKEKMLNALEHVSKCEDFSKIFEQSEKW